MYGAGIFFLSVAALLLGVFSHKLFFGDGSSVGYVDFSGLYYWAQWIGFWCAIASLAWFGLAAWQHRFPLLSRRALAPAIALALCAHFLIFSIPEASNEHGWKKSAVGWRVYVQTKCRIWNEARADAQLKAPFHGAWKTAEGASLRIKPEQIVITEPGKATEFSDANCADFSYFRYQIEDLHGVGYHFYRAGVLRTPLFLDLREAPYPVLTYTCNGRDAAFIVLAPRRLVAVLYDGSLMSFTK
jgi:hypothetical protein